MALLLCTTAAATGVAAAGLIGMEQMRRQRQRDALRAALLIDPQLLSDLAALRALEDSLPAWLLMVHVERAELVPKLAGAKLQARVKYGEPGRSLQHWSNPVSAMTEDDGRTMADFSTSCAFPWRRDLRPVIRLRIAREGVLDRVISKAEFQLPFTDTRPGRVVEDLCLFSRRPWPELIGQIRVVVELQCVQRRELRGLGLPARQWDASPSAADLFLSTGLPTPEAAPTGQDPGQHVVMGHVVAPEAGEGMQRTPLIRGTAPSNVRATVNGCQVAE